MVLMLMLLKKEAADWEGCIPEFCGITGGGLDGPVAEEPVNWKNNMVKFLNKAQKYSVLFPAN